MIWVKDNGLAFRCNDKYKLARDGNGKIILKILACEIAQRKSVSPRPKHRIFWRWNSCPSGIMTEPRKGHRDLQARIDAVPAGRYDAILVGYGLCSLMLSGLTAAIPDWSCRAPTTASPCFSVPRNGASNCSSPVRAPIISRPAGWNFPQRKTVRSAGLDALREMTDDIGSQTTPFGLGQSFADLLAKYGEENARYLLEVTQQWADHCDRGALISFDCTAQLGLRDRVKDICEKRGWQFDELAGDLGLLQRWLGGQWDDREFLIVQPQQSVYPSYNDQVIEARPVTGENS